jgi:predicted RNase H-like HicB family nuclease
VRYYQGMKFTAAIRREGAWYVAQCLDVEVASQGHTVESALENLREALSLYLEDLPADQKAATSPPLIKTIEVNA